MKTITAHVFAPQCQFHIKDDIDNPRYYDDLNAAQTPQNISSGIVGAGHVAAVFTSLECKITAFIQVLPALPGFKNFQWDRLGRATLICDSGRLLIVGSADDPTPSSTLEVRPGTYEILVGFMNLNYGPRAFGPAPETYHIYLARINNGDRLDASKAFVRGPVTKHPSEPQKPAPPLVARSKPNVAHETPRAAEPEPVELSDELKEVAYDFANEITDGKWAHVIYPNGRVRRDDDDDSLRIIDVFRARCPGYSDEQYSRALSHGFFESMW
jgi:hypothetical protein